MKSDRMPRPWTAICPLDDIVPNTGVCALVNGEQVAVFHVMDTNADTNTQIHPAVYAIENFDPGSQAAVLSRGLIGSLGERLVVASPIYKHHFDLRTGECLETPSYSVSAFDARIENGQVWVAV
jgi:nitrite reductase (NADH) small subunit